MVFIAFLNSETKVSVFPDAYICRSLGLNEFVADSNNVLQIVPKLFPIDISPITNGESMRLVTIKSNPLLRILPKLLIEFHIPNEISFFIAAVSNFEMLNLNSLVRTLV